MNQDYVTQLRLQLREAALQEERRPPLAQRFVRARRGLPGPAPLVAALALVLFALAAAIGALQLHDDAEPVKPKVIHTFHVADNLLSLSAGFGAAWLSDPVRGRVLRVDPKTRKVTASIDPAPPATGRPAVPTAPAAPPEVAVVAGAGAVWALTGDLLTGGSQGPVELARIDPATNRAVAHIPVRSPQGDNFAPLSLRVGDGHVWVMGALGALRIDPRRNAADRFVGFEQGRGAVAEGERVWTLTAEGRLRELDARTGKIVNEVALDISGQDRLIPGPRGLLALAGDTGLRALDHGGKEVWRTDLGDVVRACACDDDSLWVAVSQAAPGPDRLVRLDADTGRPTGQLSLRDGDPVAVQRVGDETWMVHAGGDVAVVR